jgi:hypothetical protein
MHRVIPLLLAVLLALSSVAAAQSAPVATGPSASAPTAGTGDAWVDRSLRDIDRYGQRYPEAFADELVRYFDAPRDLVIALLTREHLAAGDLYAGCALAHVAGQPCRAVIASWRQSGDAGWSATAQRLGVVPGSPPFARLRQALVDSYAHWDRPLVDTGADPHTRGDRPAPAAPAR